MCPRYVDLTLNDDPRMCVCVCVCACCVCVCVCARARMYNCRLPGTTLCFNPPTGDIPKSGDVPGRYNHANQLLITFWTCLMYSMHILKKEPAGPLKSHCVCIGRRKRSRRASGLKSRFVCIVSEMVPA